MVTLLTKIFSTSKTVVDIKPANKGDFQLLGAEINVKTKKLFRGSLAIRVVTAGGTNACEQELVALSNAYYDVERFGIHFVASPRHADMIMVTGPVSRNMREALIKTYEATPDPKIVVAVGDDAINGGVFKGSYSVCDGAKDVIPVDYAIPGDPPSPSKILSALLEILSDVEVKKQ
jgi:Ni,Fe-hydrogenase III small subunit